MIDDLKNDYQYVLGYQAAEKDVTVTINGLKTTIDRMEASALRDKEVIKSLQEQITELQMKLDSVKWYDHYNERIDW